MKKDPGKITKKSKIMIVLGIILLVLIVGTIVIVILFTGKDTGVKEPKPVDGTGDQVTLIKGPRPGEGGNDNDQLFNSLTISPTNPDIVYMGSEGNGIFKSIDGGTTWEWLRKGLKHAESWYPEVYDMAIDPSDESIVYAACTSGPEPPEGRDPSKGAIGGLYKSTNGGKSWVQKNSGLPNASVNCIALDPGDPSHLFVGSNGEKPTDTRMQDTEIPGGIFESNNGGDKWAALPIPEKGISNKFIKILARGTGPTSLFTTGLTWKQGGRGQPYQQDFENSLGMIKSSDGGNTWQNISPSDLFVTHFDVSEDASLVYANSPDTYRIEKSEDGGNAWGAISAQANGPIEISPHDNNIVFFCGATQIFKSTDGLSTHAQVFTVPEGIDDIEVSPSNPNVVYVGAKGLIIYKSLDGGASFERIADLRSFIDSQPE